MAPEGSALYVRKPPLRTPCKENLVAFVRLTPAILVASVFVWTP